MATLFGFFGRKDPIESATRSVVERLEQRQLLSASLDDGLLTITGTDGNDRVSIMKGAKGNLLQVTLNGQKSTFKKFDVKRVLIDGMDGNDSLQVWEAGMSFNVPVTIRGGDGNDTLSGASGKDVLEGGAGDDLLSGGKDNDRLDGGAGNDRLLGGKGRDTVFGGVGDDTIITGGDNHDVNDGGLGDDKIEAGAHHNFPTFTYTGQPVGYTPAQHRNAYGLGDLGDKNYKNRGKGQAIAIVVAHHSPFALADLNAFSREFGLPRMRSPHFKQVYASGRQPTFDEGWNGEAMLDTQWAHAIAPAADIILVEADSPGGSDIEAAIDKAIDILNKKYGGGVLSLSLGFPTESPEQAALAQVFASKRAQNVSVIVSTGDFGGVVPGAPNHGPHVTNVSGTKLYLDDYGNRVPGNNVVAIDPATLVTEYSGDSGAHELSGCTDLPLVPGGERTWWNASAGASTVFNAPFYQQNRGITGGRGIPDVAFNGDPATGVTVFNSAGSGGGAGWAQVGGTSAGAPQFAAMIALANELRRAPKGKKKLPFIGSTLQERIYRLGDRGPDAYFNDITIHGSVPDAVAAVTTQCPDGDAPPIIFTWYATPGWDLATGFGSPNAQSLVPALAEIRPRLTARRLRVSGQAVIDLNLIDNTGGGNGGPVISVPNLFRVGFQGFSRVAGLNTLTMNAISEEFVFTQNATDIVTVDIFGISSQNGQAVPNARNAVTQESLGGGTPIRIIRNGNTLTGTAFVVIEATIADPNGGTGQTQVLVSGAIRFRGSVGKNGSVTGKWFTIDSTFAGEQQTPFDEEFSMNFTATVKSF